MYYDKDPVLDLIFFLICMCVAGWILGHSQEYEKKRQLRRVKKHYKIPKKRG